MIWKKYLSKNGMLFERYLILDKQRRVILKENQIKNNS